MSQISSVTLGAIVAIGDPPPFDPLEQDFQVLELEYRGICQDQMQKV